MKPEILIKRAYEKPEKKDGYRILVDRLWPRGIKKEEAAIVDWQKELAPSTELRKWFGHDPAVWTEFQKKYLAELKKNDAVAEFVEANKDRKKITLVYGAKDTEHTHALVLQQFLEGKF
ncbi:DUF488 domain-containing protein [Taibaiella soli]|uniref:DUF488 domain-containing protein n=1 Tax=Taibaiella soli TaxID=1649169 RepID=A0A2W2BGB2_9BACT|nr:DUF488 domain-containing protein [Taibaiella soli]PZF74927.1 DUF488 domain-containing protein [Taibaiella soli]